MYVIPVSFFKSHPEFVSALTSALFSNSVFYAYESDVEELDSIDKERVLDLISFLEFTHES